MTRRKRYGSYWAIALAGGMLAATVLTGCGATGREAKSSQSASEVNEQLRQMKEGIQDANREKESQQETQTETMTEEAAGEIFKVDIETIDGSRRDDEGNVLANIYMQYPVVSGSTPAVDAINAFFEDVPMNYSPLDSGVLDYVDMELENGAEMDVFPFEDRTDCVVTCNNGTYFAVIGYDTWYAGGVANSGATGYTFSATTGQKLNITDFFPDQTPDEVKEMLVGKCQEMFAQSPDEGWNLDAVKAYQVEDYNFYLLDGTIYLCFGPYEICYGGWYREVPVGTYEL